MEKKTIKLLILLPIMVVTVAVLWSCSIQASFYQGRLVGEDGLPLEGVLVKRRRASTATVTDSNGYFKLERTPESLDDLLFNKAGYEPDTIPSVYTRAGESVAYNFIEGTTVVVLKKIRVVAPKSIAPAAALQSDTLQYLGDGENEDNIYQMFLDRGGDTISIVFTDMEHFDPAASRNKMFVVGWENEMMTAGGDTSVHYEQAFMKYCKSVECAPFRKGA